MRPHVENAINSDPASSCCAIPWSAHKPQLPTRMQFSVPNLWNDLGRSSSRTSKHQISKMSDRQHHTPHFSPHHPTAQNSEFVPALPPSQKQFLTRMHAQTTNVPADSSPPTAAHNAPRKLPPSPPYACQQQAAAAQRPPLVTTALLPVAQHSVLGMEATRGRCAAPKTRHGAYISSAGFSHWVTPLERLK